MLQRLVNTFIAALELLEAESDRMRHIAVRAAGDAACLVALLTVTTVGLLATLTGVTWVIATHVGVGWSLLIVGGGVSLTAGFIALLIYRKTKYVTRRSDQTDTPARGQSADDAGHDGAPSPARDNGVAGATAPQLQPSQLQH